MTTTTFQVPDIHCEHCKTSIENAVSLVSGVDRVEVTIPARTVDVVFDEAQATRAAIVDAIESQGYVVTG